MATVLGTVISISLETDVVKQAGGTYKGWELVYKSQDGKVYTIAKPVQGLKFGPLRAQLASLSQGDKFTLTQEKNAQNFNDVKSVVAGWDAYTPTPEGAKETPTKPSTVNSYQASSYPTKEEREATQNHIIRQSSLAQAVATLAIGGKAVKIAEVLATANEYVNWVKHKPEGMEALQEMEDDIPY